MEEIDPTGEGLVPARGLSLAGRGLFGELGEKGLHVRTLIRRYVVARLREAAEAAQGRVFSSRIAPLRKATLPCLVVWTRNEKAEIYNTAPRSLERACELVVDVYAALNETLDEVLDQMAKRVEWLVHRDESQGGLAKSTVLTSTETGLAREGQKVFGRAGLIFTVKYELPTEEDVLPVFKGMNVQWDLAPTDGRIDAEDRLDFEE